MTEGSFNVFDNKTKNTVIGRGIKYSLGINPKSNFESISAYVLNDSIKISPQMLNQNIYEKNNLNVVGVFAIENDFDNNYIFTSLKNAQKILKKDMMISGYEIKLNDNTNLNAIKEEINKLIGDNYLVMSFEEIREGLYKVLETEKLVVYAIFSMVLALSSLNIFFLLIMMSVEKTKDISILYSLGIKKTTIRNAFLLQGALIGIIGTTVGICLGVLISYVQQETGLVKINLPNSLIDAYPVKINIFDLTSITLIVLIISTVASIFPSIITSSNKIFQNINNNLS